jgi:hypothetical protein
MAPGHGALVPRVSASSKSKKNNIISTAPRDNKIIFGRKEKVTELEVMLQETPAAVDVGHTHAGRLLLLTQKKEFIL